MQHTIDSGPISPELILVSPPEIARWARGQLPDPPGPSVRRAQVLDAQSLFAAAEEAVASESRPWFRRGSRAVTSALLYVSAAAAVAVVGLPLTGWAAAERPYLVDRAVATSREAPLLSLVAAWDGSARLESVAVPPFVAR